MKQLYYAIQTILHGRGSNVTKLISLSLGLTIGILLFSQIAFELSYEKCYPDAERLALARELFIDSKSGKIVGDDGDNYDYTLFAPVAAALAENLPEQIESATCIYPDNAWNLYIIRKSKFPQNPKRKRSIFREKDKTKRSKKESAQHSKSRNKSFVMTSVSAL